MSTKGPDFEDPSASDTTIPPALPELPQPRQGTRQLCKVSCSVKPHPEGPRDPITPGRMLLSPPVSTLRHSSTRTQTALLYPSPRPSTSATPAPSAPPDQC